MRISIFGIYFYTNYRLYLKIYLEQFLRLVTKKINFLFLLQNFIVKKFFGFIYKSLLFINHNTLCIKRHLDHI